MHLLASGIAFTDTLFALMLVLTACGCFVVGINLMSRGFVHASTRTDSFFTRGFDCKNRFAGAGFGFLHSFMTQSSDVTSVTLVRLSDIGAITLFQACACIIGANIGTTATTFIASLSGIEHLTDIFAFLAFIGAVPLLSKKRKVHIFGEIVAGFGILFVGLRLLGQEVENPAFRELVSTIFLSTEAPILLVGIGIVLTSLVQSSSVVTSMVVFLTIGNLLPLPSALCLVVGANVGTCITAWIASIGSSRNARVTAMFHTLFNIVGASIFMVVMYTPIRDPFISWVEGVNTKAEYKVALFHLIFNLTAALVMIPLLRPSVWLSKKIVRH